LLRATKRRYSMFARRRPLARAAVVGGTAYYAGKKGAQSAQREADQNAQIAELQDQQYQQQAAAPAAPEKDPMETLKELAALHEQGVLTDAEFEIQKTKILQSM
jgi:membrane protease subunit (stomatin/prohibitin family)